MAPVNPSLIVKSPELFFGSSIDIRSHRPSELECPVNSSSTHKITEITSGSPNDIRSDAIPQMERNNLNKLYQLFYNLNSNFDKLKNELNEKKYFN